MHEIAKKRELMGACRTLIPAMDDVELNTLAMTLNTIIDNMIKRGVEVADDN